MAAIKLVIKLQGPLIVNDLGLTISGDVGDIYDLVDERAEDVSNSADLQAAVTAGAITVLDPRDPNELIELSETESAQVLRNHNQIHWGVLGGRFAALDDPNIALTEDHVVTIGPNGTTATAKPLTDVLASTDNSSAIQDIVGDMFSAEDAVSYDSDTGKLDLEDNFLRNTGDTLSSGTLEVAPSATINVASGGELTVQDAPVNPKDVTNKEYVDALANGMDHKESVQAASVVDTGFTYVDAGANGVGDTLTAPAVGATVVDGVTLEDGDRILIKDQIDPTQNGIYVVSGADAASETVFTRAEDQDGSSSNEVSAGNTTFVEGGTVNGSTGWVVTGDGELSLNTDDVNWTQNSGQGTYGAGEGLALNGTEFSVITTNVSVAPDSVELTDEIIIGDVSDSTNTAKTTFGDVLTDLGVVNGITGEGFPVRLADGSYTSREIEVAPAGDLGGLVISDGDGVANNPVIGLDIQNTPSRDAIASDDLVIVYDVSADENRTYTINEIAESATANAFVTIVADGNTTGDVNIVADQANDTFTIGADGGLSLDVNNADSELRFSLNGNSVDPIASDVSGTDELLVVNPTTGEVTKVTFDDLVNDLDLVGSVSISTAAGEQGIVIDNTDPSNPTIGLDIDNLTDSTDELSATDELAAFNGIDNVSMSGQQLADGVAAILGIPDISMSDINGQQIATIPDSTRADKELSVDSNTFMWSENALSNNDWIEIAGARDADSGYIMPLDGTIVMATAHCENAQEASTINIYNGASTTPVAAAGSFVVSPNAQFVNTTLNVDFNQGDRIRLRNVGGNLRDTAVSIFVKWRA